MHKYIHHAESLGWIRAFKVIEGTQTYIETFDKARMHPPPEEARYDIAPLLQAISMVALGDAGGRDNMSHSNFFRMLSQ